VYLAASQRQGDAYFFDTHRRPVYLGAAPAPLTGRRHAVCNGSAGWWNCFQHGRHQHLPSAVLGRETENMESRAKLLGHAIHPVLIVFPLGLLGMAVVFDLIYIATRTADLTIASYWMIAAGVVMGLVAALFGLWDWLAVPAGTRAKGIGLWHGVGNVVVVLLFILSWLMRRGVRSGGAEYAPDGLPFVLELGALVLALITSWLGGELVQRLGVGVDRGAHLDAPSSLSGREAHETQVPTATTPRTA
jgi:uncharacterized membrane protein